MRVMRGFGPAVFVLSLTLTAGIALGDEVQSPFTDIPAATSPKKKPPAPAYGPSGGTSNAGGDASKPYLAPMSGAAGPQNYQPAAGREGAREAVYSEPPRTAGAPPGPDPLKSLPPPDERSRGVEREDLAPVMANDGSGLPLELWRGLDMKAIETLVSRLEIPPRSPALHALWHRLVTANVAAPAGAERPQSFEAVRIEALLRSGLVQEASARLAKEANAASDPMLAPLFARAEIALGRRDQGCAAAKTVSASRANLPKPMRLEALLMLGYCAAAATNPAAAGLAADLARDEGFGDTLGVLLLDAVANGAKPQIKPEKALSIIDYRLIELTKTPLGADMLERAQPAALAVIAADANAEPATRLAASEAAVRLNAVTADALADTYRGANSAGETSEVLLNAQARAGKSDATHRAQLFKAAESERTPLKKVRLIRAFLDDARRATLYLPALQMSARAVEAIEPVPEIGWFAETATEVLIAAGKYDRARAWARFGGGLDRPGLAGGPGSSGGTFGHWLALADIADPAMPREQRGRDFGAVEDLALKGRFAPEQLHRLATVLDALDYNVPMRLWEAASRTPQPTSGHLPPTGVLSELQDASKKKEFGRTVLLAMDALGPHGAEGAHMIALGDSIRALRRAGLDADARRLGLEALFAMWPRTATN